MILRGLALIERHWVMLTVAIGALITLVSLTPLPHLPEVPGSDKTHHLIAYAALVFPVAWARPRVWMWLVLGAVAYSGVIELTQPFVNRYGEWGGLAANAAGAYLGVTIAWALSPFKLTRPE